MERKKQLARNASRSDAGGPDKIQTKPKRRLHREIVKQMVTLATSGFGLVAALAWNNVIQEFVDTMIKPYLPHGGKLVSLLLYAGVVTILAVTITLNLSKLLEKMSEE